MLTDEGEAAADLAVPRDRHEVFGRLDPDRLAMLVGINAAAPNALRAASAEARERA
ncbi:hypothetical protein ACVNF4_28645 [Streptomyces sp. S6]